MISQFLPTTRWGAFVSQWLGQARTIARLEAAYFFHRSKRLWYWVAAVVIPSLYLVIYLSSLWDPASHSTALQVGIVNLDRGLVYRERPFNVGLELSNTLQTAGLFDYRLMASAEEAKTQVRQGRLAFSLIIPPDFSSNAVPGQLPGAGQLVIFASQGNNIETTRIAQQFAAELGHKINESLNAQRLSLVLSTAAGSNQSLTQLHEGMAQLRLGAEELSQSTAKAALGAQSVHTGATQLNQNVSSLVTGVKTMGAGLRSMEAQRPRNSDLRRLDAGAQSLVTGLTDLGQGLNRLQNSTREIHEKVDLFKPEVDSSWLVPATVRDNVSELSQRLGQLDQGMQSAVNGEQQLQDGARSLNTGVQSLTTGLRSMNLGLRNGVAQLPEDAKLDALDSGTSELAGAAQQLAQGNAQINEGSQRLKTGLDLMDGAIPKMNDGLDGSPEGLADSVRPVVEIEAPVQNNGIGFIANVIPAALWLGAGLAVFLVNLRVQARQAQAFHPGAQWIGKLVLPGLLMFFQGALILLTVWFLLGVKVVQPWALVCTVMTAGLAFFCLITAFTHFMGDAGKALAMVLLAVQMTSSNGVMPVELSGGFVAALSPWLPITWLAQGLKAALFGAFEGVWITSWLQLAAMGLAAALVCRAFGRWRFVSVRQIRPQLDM